MSQLDWHHRLDKGKVRGGGGVSVAAHASNLIRLGVCHEFTWTCDGDKFPSEEYGKVNERIHCMGDVELYAKGLAEYDLLKQEEHAKMRAEMLCANAEALGSFSRACAMQEGILNPARDSIRPAYPVGKVAEAVKALREARG